eukprot:scaffold157453_cov21-Tisochrysis_lutea.AAC.1
MDGPAGSKLLLTDTEPVGLKAAPGHGVCRGRACADAGIAGEEGQAARVPSTPVFQGHGEGAAAVRAR